MSAGLRRYPHREAAVLAVGAVLGAGLVWLGSTFARPEPVVLPVPAPVSVPTPAPPPVAVVVAPVAPPLAPPASPAPVAAQAPRARRPSLSKLPDGVFARLRRSHRQYSGEVAKLLGSGSHLLEEGASWKAMVNYSAALDLDRGNRDALMGLALCHYELGHAKETNQLLQRLLAADRTHPEALILRGFMAQLAGKSARAVEWYERALPRIDDDAVAEELRAVIAALRPVQPSSPTITASAEK
jgi:tetratricopeptide (TPR) repeat protein